MTMQIHLDLKLSTIKLLSAILAPKPKFDSAIISSIRGGFDSPKDVRNSAGNPSPLSKDHKENPSPPSSPKTSRWFHWKSSMTIQNSLIYAYT